MKKHKFVQHFLFLLLLIAASCIVLMSMIQQPEYLSFNGVTYEVAVLNGFSGNSSLPLVIWCSAVGDADGYMGGRALQEGDDYSWNVRVSFWKWSAFTCTMKWDQKRKEFEAFGVHRDRFRCGVLRRCLWLVKEDGFYFSNDENNWVKEFSWP